MTEQQTDNIGADRELAEAIAREENLSASQQQSTATVNPDALSAATAAATAASNNQNRQDQLLTSPVEAVQQEATAPFGMLNLYSGSMLSTNVFKTSNRIIEDIRFDLHSLLQDDGASQSLLNSKTVDYSRKLSTFTGKPYSIVILNNEVDYSPYYEKIDSFINKANFGDQQTHVLRCLLVDEANQQQSPISDTKLFHLNIKVKKKLELENGGSTTPKQKFFLIQKHELFEEDCNDLYSVQSDYLTPEKLEEIRKTTYVEEDQNDIEVKIKALQSAVPKIVDSATYVSLDSQTLVHVEISEQELTRQDLLEFEPQQIKLNNAGEVEPTQSECLKTLFKLLKGPILYNSNSAKAIKASHKIINSHVQKEFLFNRLFFAETSDGEELTPINYLHYPEPLLQATARNWLMRLILEVIYLGLKVNNTKSAIADHNYARNAHFKSYTFSYHIPIFYRILNEFDLISSIKYESSYKDLSFKLSSFQLSFKSEDYINLSIFSFYGTDLIVENFNFLKQVDPINVPIYFQSMKNVAQLHKNNYSDMNNLEMFLAKELSVGTLSVDDINSAFRHLGIGNDDSGDGNYNKIALIKHFQNVDDDTIVAAYKFQIAANPALKNDLRSSLSTLANFKRSDKLFNVLNTELQPLADAYANLGILDQVDDETVLIAYEIKRNDEPNSVEIFNKALQSVAVYRRSHSLLNFCEINLPDFSSYLLSEQQISEKDCYDFLKVDRYANDFQVLSILEQIFANENKLIQIDENQYSIDHPHFEGILDNFRKLRLYLRKLNEYRKSTIIDYFLANGKIHPSSVPLDEWPTGLNNIGNTCYLNSLLQFYFVIKPLRDLVLNFEKSFPVTFNEELANNERFKNRRIGGRTVKYKEVERSYQFVYNLRDLFRDMIYANSRDIIPSKELAYLAFSPITQEVEFESKDAGEDKIKPVEDAEQPEVNVIEPDVFEEFHKEHADGPANSNEDNVRDDLMDIDPPEFKNASSEASSGGSKRKHSLEFEEDSSKPQMLRKSTSHNKDEYPNFKEVENRESKQEFTDSDSEMIETPESDDSKKNEEKDLVALAKETQDEKKAGPSAKETNEVTEQATTIHNSTAVAKISFDQLVNTLEIGRQQDVTECIENVLFQLEASFDPIKFEEDDEQFDTIKQLFYGKTKQTLEPLNNPSKTRSKTERYLSFLVNIGDHPRDMYDALDGYFTEDVIQLSEDGDVKRSLTLTEIPEILQIHIQRVQYDLQRGVAFKSTQPLPFSEKLYLDRYMETNDEQIIAKRQENAQWKKQIADLKSRLKLITTKNSNGLTVKDSLISTKSFLESEVIAQNGFTIQPETINVIQKQIDSINHDLTSLKSQISDLEGKIDQQFESYKKIGYELFAIFIHRGEASYGHYWIYIRDPKRNIYRKYNDETVTEVQLEEIFNFNEDNTATPYFVVYAKENKFIDYIEPLKRVVHCSTSC